MCVCEFSYGVRISHIYIIEKVVLVLVRHYFNSIISSIIYLRTLYLVGERSLIVL